MKDNIIKNKSFSFAVRVVRLYKYLCEEKKEYILSKQLLRSGTSVGAMVRESEFAESKKDFIHKMSISQKELNESIYWLELLKETDFITDSQFQNINDDSVEIMKIITSIIKSAKRNMNS